MKERDRRAGRRLYREVLFTQRPEIGMQWATAELLPKREQQRVQTRLLFEAMDAAARLLLSRSRRIAMPHFDAFVIAQLKTHVRALDRDPHPYELPAIVRAFVPELAERFPMVTWAATRKRLRALSTTTTTRRPKRSVAKAKTRCKRDGE